MKAKIVTLEDLEADRNEEMVLLQTEMMFMKRQIFLKGTKSRSGDILAIKRFNARMQDAQDKYLGL